MLYVCATAQLILCEREEAHAFLIPLFYCGSSDLLGRKKNVTKVTRPASDPRCYWLLPHKPLPNVFGRFGKLPIFGCFVPKIISPIDAASRLQQLPEGAGGHSTTGSAPLIYNLKPAATGLF